MPALQFSTFKNRIYPCACIKRLIFLLFIKKKKQKTTLNCFLLYFCIVNGANCLPHLDTVLPLSLNLSVIQSLVNSCGSFPANSPCLLSLLCILSATCWHRHKLLLLTWQIKWCRSVVGGSKCIKFIKTWAQVVPLPCSGWGILDKSHRISFL